MNTPAAYIDLLQQGRPFSGAIQGLCGRIIRGRTPSDFETLTDDPDRQMVMLFGPDGLHKLLGQSGWDMLTHICGHTPEHVRHNLLSGKRFRFVVFPEDAGAKIATWDNVAAMLAAIYPEIRGDIYNHLPRLRSMSFEELQSLAGFRFLDVENEADKKANPRFMTFDRFRQSARGLADLRAFLYFTCHLRELFSGDGYTYDNAGNQGLMEYIVLNRPLRELGEYVYHDLSVVIPR